MLQNVTVTAFSICDLLRENQQYKHKASGWVESETNASKITNSTCRSKDR